MFRSDFACDYVEARLGGFLRDTLVALKTGIYGKTSSRSKSQPQRMK